MFEMSHMVEIRVNTRRHPFRPFSRSDFICRERILMLPSGKSERVPAEGPSGSDGILNFKSPEGSKSEIEP